MLSALALADAILSDNSLDSSTMSAAVGGSGDRRTPTLVSLSHRHGGDGTRSSSPAAAYPENAGVAKRQETPPFAHSKTGMICSPCSAEATNTPPQRQSARPRTASLSFSPFDVNGEGDAVPQSFAKPPAAAAAMPATDTSSSPATPPVTSDMRRNDTEHGGDKDPHLDATVSVAANARAGTPVVAGPCGGKTPKREQKTEGGTRRPCHSNGNGGGSSRGASLRSASERCKAARTLAAELMSALMKCPPQAAQVAQYRQLKRSSASSTPTLSPGAAATAASAATRDSTAELAAEPSPAQHPTEPSDVSVGGRVAATTVPTAASAPSSVLSSTFLEAVINGGPKSSHTSSSPSSPAAPGSSAAGGRSATTSPTATFKGSGDATVQTSVAGPPANPNGSVRLHSNSPISSLPPAGKAEGPGRRPLELVPEDTSTTPQILKVLREIALSCAPLDALGKASSPSANASLATGTRGGAAAAEPPAVASTTPSKGIATGVGAVPQSADATRHTAAASTAAGLSRPHHEVEGTYYEGQWQRVRTLLQTVRRMVLNGHEFATMLDELLGVDWRGETVAGEPMEPPFNKAVLTSSATPPASTAEETVRTAAEAVLAAAVIPVMPTPVDLDGPTQPAVKGAGTRGKSSMAVPSAPTAKATTTATILNHNARPFHSQTPFTAQQAVSAQGGGPPTTTGGASPLIKSALQGRHNSGGPAAAHCSSSAETGPNNVSSSMKQLSESSATYSPSQHVATFLERTTPPASNRVADEGDAGLLNFPSTPLSEDAVPYQPTVAFVGGTSPRGGNGSSSSSTLFRLESREEMLRRRSAAPNAFYASITHSGATHYLGGPPSAATTPGTFATSPVPPGSPPFTLPGSGARSMPVSPLLSYGSPTTTSQCPYDYILVLDFEATCEERPPPNYLYEIIEFPVVMVDVRLQRVVAEFHRFVRPRHKVELSGFCKELTGMRQEDVDAAAPLEEVILQFERWLAHTLPPQARCVFATDGPMDMREFMFHHSVSRQGIRFPPLFYQYIDVKQIFACFFQCSKGKIKAMLEVLHLPFEGRLHSGLDDARNIASIVIGLLQYGCSFCEVPLNRLPFSRLLPSGVTAAATGSGSTSLSLPPSTAAASAGRYSSDDASPTRITAPYSVDEDEYSY